MSQTIEIGTADAVAVYCAIAERFGLGVAFCPQGGPEYTFDGKTIHVFSDWRDSSFLSNLAHDLGHFVAAPRYRRKVPEWGLGPSPDVHSDAVRMVERSHAETEERIASLVGIRLQRVVEGHAAAFETWADHGWLGSDFPQGLQVARWPRARKAWRELSDALHAVTGDGGKRGSCSPSTGQGFDERVAIPSLL